MIVSVQDVSKQYAGEYIFKDVALEIAAGESIAVYGGNGSGKTTLLRIINLLEPLSSGRLLYRPEGEKGLSFQVFSGKNTALRRKMVMTPQTPFIFKGDVLFNASVGLKIRGENKDAEQLLKWFGLWGDRNRNASLLSAGQKQKVSLARSFLPASELFLLDEPENHLDDAGKSVLKRLIARGKKEGKSFVISTTDISDWGDFPFDKTYKFKGGLLYDYHSAGEKTGMERSRALIRGRS